MSGYSFHLRLNCQYEGDDNKVASIAVESRVDDEWKALNLDLDTPGFLIFVYSIFTCQHMYMRLNAAEHNLLLDSATGSIEVETDADWQLTRLYLDFEARLASGNPTAEDVDMIIGRMLVCPVSKNLKLPADCRTELRFI